MAKQTINVGTIANDSTGDTLRVAFTKVNANFTELYTDISTLSDVAFSGSYTDLLNTPTVVGASDRLVNGNKELILGANGTLTVPSPTSNQFATVFSAANYVPTLGKPTLTLTGTPWALNGQYVYAQNGETQLALDNIWPTLNNPGYTSGDTFTFDSTVHGIADFVLTIQLNDVVQAGPAGWTANVAASQPPVYASTIKSLGAVKVTASNSSWIFGTDGKLHYPDGSFSNTAFVGQATSAETLINENNATITTGSVLGTQYIWNFDTDGNLTLPKELKFNDGTSSILALDPTISGGIGGLSINGKGRTYIAIGDDSYGYMWDFRPFGLNDFDSTVKPAIMFPGGGWLQEDLTDIINDVKPMQLGSQGSLTLTTKSNDMMNPTDYNWVFKDNGGFEINGSTTIATNGWGNLAQPTVNSVVYTSKAGDLASIRVHATIEGISDDDPGDISPDSDVFYYHTQACDMMIVRRVGPNNVSTVDSVVYGIIYTSINPLATLDAQWNSAANGGNGGIEITVIPTSIINPVNVKIHATEVYRGD